MTAATHVRVLLADDDSASRAGIRMSLAGKGFDVCGEADTADAACDAARRRQPDLCLVEADLPGGGAAAVAGILEDVPRTAVVMLSATVTDERLFAALRAGARGYLLKDMDPARLPMALRGVLDGEAALPRPLMSRVLEEFRAHAGGRHASELRRLGVRLTRREREILELLDRGLDTAQMSQLLGISAVTVRRHVSHILRKLQAPDRDAALRILRQSAADAFID
jgi:DNA-binding NarL/FixJ family response regulator